MTDEITQAEKKQVLKDCYLSRAQAEADMVGGRFKRQTETRVTGTPTYPQQPASSPWSRGIDELTGREGPFSIDIDFVGDLGGASAPASSPCAVETASSTRGASSLTGAPRFLRRRV
jgi:hypothetical protein